LKAHILKLQILTRHKFFKNKCETNTLTHLVQNLEYKVGDDFYFIYCIHHLSSAFYRGGANLTMSSSSFVWNLFLDVEFGRSNQYRMAGVVWDRSWAVPGNRCNRQRPWRMWL